MTRKIIFRVYRGTGMMPTIPGRLLSLSHSLFVTIKLRFGRHWHRLVSDSLPDRYDPADHHRNALLMNFSQCLIKIVAKIFIIFTPDGNANEFVAHAGFFFLRFRYRCMGH